MDKYQRNYELSFLFYDGSELVDTIKITLPFTIDFDVVRHQMKGANTLNLRIYNLNEINRGKIRKDYTNTIPNQKVILRAGYGDQLSTIFAGRVSLAQSVRNGVDFITTVQAFDGMPIYTDALFNRPYAAGYPYRQVIIDLIDSLSIYGIQKGFISDKFTGNLLRGNTYSGITVDLLHQLTGGAFFVDNETANVIFDSEYIAGDIPVLSVESGLLNTPERQQNIINLDILFDPQIYVNQKIILQSQTNQNFDTYYKVIEIHHKGMISDAVCGNLITTLGLWSNYDFLEVKRDT